MALIETGTHISDLNAANPVSTDGLAQCDDHLRLIKSVSWRRSRILVVR